MKFLSLLALCTFSTAFQLQAQLFENFDNGNKSSYSAAVTTLDSGDWFFNDALINNQSGDKAISGKSARLRDGHINTNFDKLNGAGVVRFYAANAGFSNDTGGKLQVSISSDQGSTWTNIGTEITLTDDLVLYEIPVNQNGAYRFKITRTAGGRISIDNFEVTDFVELAEEPTLIVQVNAMDFDNRGTYTFAATPIGQNRSVSVSLSNLGEQTLEINNAAFAGTGFSVDGIATGQLASRETFTFSVIFEPTLNQTYTDSLTIESNDPSLPQYVLNFEGGVFEPGEIISIAQARELPFGTEVTVTGWVTVGNEFNGPVYMQDETAGIAVFFSPLHSAVQRGDSIVVTGPVSEFNPIGGTPGTFLRQITGDEVLFTVHPEGSKTIEPKPITLLQMNNGCCESQLVVLENITFNDTGVFPTNSRNYEINQGSTFGQIRIDTRSDFSGAAIPTEPVTVVGVVDRFSGVYQIKPRNTLDIGAEAVTLPFEDISRDLTFEAVTWNIEWFGNSSNGPEDVNLQFQNVKRVIETIDADLYALQEISNTTIFNQLVDSLTDYNGFIANYSQTQRTAYLYKHTTVDSLTSGYVAESGAWGGGRTPFMFLFNATSNGKTERIRAINFHAKAFSELDSYNERVSDSAILKEYTDTRVSVDNLLILGDYNDDVLVSTYNAQVSPYKNFDDDPSYFIVTKSLSERGITSYRSVSMIDHITINTRLKQFYLDGTERTENVSYIGNYLSTTSDHYPVWTRFLFAPISSTEYAEDLPNSVELQQNYPNPFNPATTIAFTLPQSEFVRITIYDITGRLVATVADRVFTRGTHTIDFDASGLTSGVYLYRLESDSGNLARKMMLLK